MLISELIKLLQGYLAEHGDIPAVVATGEASDMGDLPAEAAGACLAALLEDRIIFRCSVRYTNELPKAVWLL